MACAGSPENSQCLFMFQDVHGEGGVRMGPPVSAVIDKHLPCVHELLLRHSGEKPLKS